jgi:hypothetical protein
MTFFANGLTIDFTQSVGKVETPVTNSLASAD